MLILGVEDVRGVRQNLLSGVFVKPGNKDGVDTKSKEGNTISHE